MIRGAVEPIVLRVASTAETEIIATVSTSIGATAACASILTPLRHSFVFATGSQAVLPASRYTASFADSAKQKTSRHNEATKRSRILSCCDMDRFPTVGPTIVP